MIRIHLAPDEVEQLDQAFRHTTDTKLRDRLHIIRLAQRGRAHHAIAEDLAITPRTVQRWLNAFLERGLDGLQPRKAPGAKAKIPAELADEVRGWIIDGPAKQGLDRANWTYAELTDHLLKVKGIRSSRSALQRFCWKLGVRVYRPTYRYLRGKPEKQAQAREEIAELKRGPKRMSWSC
jgi:transposase